MIRLATAAALALVPLAAAAQDTGAGLAFTLGVGVESVPEYLGSDDQAPRVAFSFDLGYVGLGPVRFGSRGPEEIPEGLGFRGSFRYVPERSGEEFEGAGRLADPVDAAFEVGGGLRYAQPSWEAFAVARRGFGGHEGFVGDVGVDLIARPAERLTLRAGPRLFLGDDEFAGTYFDAPGFEAEGGILSSGLAVGAGYSLSDAWGLAASIRYDRLQQDAAASPVSAEDDQFSAELLVTRRLDIRF
jgi:outer membrane scaffolding protein for murein synthesis (MipA/OmpV family)